MAVGWVSPSDAIGGEEHPFRCGLVLVLRLGAPAHPQPEPALGQGQFNGGGEIHLAATGGQGGGEGGGGTTHSGVRPVGRENRAAPASTRRGWARERRNRLPLPKDLLAARRKALVLRREISSIRLLSAMAALTCPTSPSAEKRHRPAMPERPPWCGRLPWVADLLQGIVGRSPSGTCLQRRPEPFGQAAPPGRQRAMGNTGAPLARPSLNLRRGGRSEG